MNSSLQVEVQRGKTTPTYYVCGRPARASRSGIGSPRVVGGEKTSISTPSHPHDILCRSLESLKSARQAHNTAGKAAIHRYLPTPPAPTLPRRPPYPPPAGSSTPRISSIEPRTGQARCRQRGRRQAGARETRRPDGKGCARCHDGWMGVQGREGLSLHLPVREVLRDRLGLARTRWAEEP